MWKQDILFIDEVYSLGNPEQRDVFTKECIDTINQKPSIFGIAHTEYEKKEILIYFVI